MSSHLSHSTWKLVIDRDVRSAHNTLRKTPVHFYNTPNMTPSSILSLSSTLCVFSLIISNPQYSKDREPRTLSPSTHGLVTTLKICTFLGGWAR